MRGIVLGYLLALGLGAGVAGGQARSTGHSTHRKHKRSQAIPVVGPAPVGPDSGAPSAAQQGAADRKLLIQQQAASAQAQQINDQQVKAAQKLHDQIQDEQRIQDAPGPGRTGVTPAPGAAVVPLNGEQRIQDAPGPAQTLPPPAGMPATTQPLRPPSTSGSAPQ